MQFTNMISLGTLDVAEVKVVANFLGRIVIALVSSNLQDIPRDEFVHYAQVYLDHRIYRTAGQRCEQSCVSIPSPSIIPLGHFSLPVHLSARDQLN